MQPQISTVASKDYSFVVLTASILGLVSNLFWHSPILSVILGTIFFSAFDAIGYFHLFWGGNQKEPVPQKHHRLVSYRFLQTSVQFLITAFLYSIAGIESAITFNLLWWFGVCDLLYYGLLKQNFFEYGEMFWLWWTPAGFLNKIRIVPQISATVAVIQGIIGLILSVVYLMH